MRDWFKTLQHQSITAFFGSGTRGSINWNLRQPAETDWHLLPALPQKAKAGYFPKARHRPERHFNVTGTGSFIQRRFDG
jgi:hypothetical protein